MKGRLTRRIGEEPSVVPATHTDHVGYLGEPFLIVGSWTVSNGGEEEGTSPNYPPTWF